MDKNQMKMINLAHTACKKHEIKYVTHNKMINLLLWVDDCFAPSFAFLPFLPTALVVVIYPKGFARSGAISGVSVVTLVKIRAGTSSVDVKTVGGLAQGGEDVPARKKM